jgi:hypothetical protein
LELSIQKQHHLIPANHASKKEENSIREAKAKAKMSSSHTAHGSSSSNVVGVHYRVGKKIVSIALGPILSCACIKERARLGCVRMAGFVGPAEERRVS